MADSDSDRRNKAGSSITQAAGNGLIGNGIDRGVSDTSSRDHRYPNSKPLSDRGGATKGEQLPNFVAHKIIGETTGSTAPTENKGALNPELARWLMGYPVEWGSSGAMAMRLFRKSQQNS